MSLWFYGHARCGLKLLAEMRNGGVILVRVLSPDDLVDLIPYGDAISAVRDAFNDLGQNSLLNRPRQRVHSPSGARISVHPGAPISWGAIGLLTHCEVVSPGATRQALEFNAPPVMVVFDSATAKLRGIVIGAMRFTGYPDAATGVRTAATSAIGTDLLARKGPIKVGLFGSGSHSFYHIMALSHVREMTEVRVFSPTVSHRLRFADEVSKLLPCPVMAVPDPGGAIDEMDVIVSCTSSSVPVFDGRRLAPGQHVTSIVGGDAGLVDGGFAKKKRREVDDYTLQRANVLMATSREQASQDRQGDLFDPAANGIISWEDISELGEVLVGARPGRTTSEQITLFKNNGGQGIADVALASLALKNAEANNIGKIFDNSYPA